MGRLPTEDDGHFNIGKWLRPTTSAALAWCILVMLMMTLPPADRTTADVHVR